MKLSDQFNPVYESEHGTARVTGEGYVYNVGIRSSERGQGHGTKLMGQITADADRLGKPLTLHAREELHPWYERQGFQVEGHDVLGPRMKRLPRTSDE